MWPQFKLRVVFVNGSDCTESFHTIDAAYDAANNRVCYSGGRVARVTLQDETGGTRSLWAKDWTDESKRAGLVCPL
jgi:hypothetical protein